MRIFYFAILYSFLVFATLISSSAFAENVSKYCSKDRCTEPIVLLTIGLFSFHAKDCTNDMNWECHSLVFGVNGNIVKLDEVFRHDSTYRIINGPLPVNLSCVDGITYGFQDMKNLEEMTGFGGIEWFDDRDYQRREKIYYKNDKDQTFSYFSEKPTTIGVFVNQHSATGYSQSTTYLFDTVTGESAQLNGDCQGPTLRTAPVTFPLTDACKQASGKESISSFQLSAGENAIPLVLRNGPLPQMSSISVGPSLNAILFEFEGKSIIHCNEPHIIPTFMLVESDIAYSLFMLDEFAVVRMHIHSFVNCGTACYYAQVDTIAFPADDWEVRGYQEIKSPTYEYPSKWFRGYLNEAEQELFDKAMAEG